jgi:hypothetical protein
MIIGKPCTHNEQYVYVNREQHQQELEEAGRSSKQEDDNRDYEEVSRMQEEY